MVDKELQEKLKIIEMLTWTAAKELPPKKQRKLAEKIGEWEARKIIKEINLTKEKL